MAELAIKSKTIANHTNSIVEFHTKAILGGTRCVVKRVKTRTDEAAEREGGAKNETQRRGQTRYETAMTEPNNEQGDICLAKRYYLALKSHKERKT